MYVLKAFVVMQPLSDNSPGALSPIGELSTYSKTFSTEIGHYSRAAQPAVDLYSFFSHQSTTGAVSVPAAIQDPLLVLSQWLYQQSVTGTFSENKQTFTSTLLAEFGSQIENLDVGDMVAADDGVSWLPQYLSFKLSGVAEDNTIKLWFSDDAFRRQYDEYAIRIVPPVDDLNNLIATPLEVKARLDQLDDHDRMERIELAKAGDPTTRVRVDIFPWFNPLQPEISLNTSWAILIYGPGGDNVDNIRNALIDYILANSTYTRDVWEQYLPDIFKITEYILTPVWDVYSIPNESQLAGLFSPTLRWSTLLEKAKTTAPQYPVVHVEEYLESSVSIWRSLGFLIVGGPDNRDEVYTFSERWSDYIVIPTTSVEFARMSPLSQGFVQRLTEMLKIAEHLTEFSDIPLHMTRVIRDGILYLVSTYEDVQYLVVSRQSYLELFEVDDSDNPLEPSPEIPPDEDDLTPDPVDTESMIFTIDTTFTPGP